jgi:hypothetical protein
MQLTAGQAGEKLARFRAGKITSRKASAGIAHRKRLAHLKRALKAADRTATRPGSWWAGPLEEAENDVI